MLPVADLGDVSTDQIAQVVESSMAIPPATWPDISVSIPLVTSGPPPVVEGTSGFVSFS